MIEATRRASREWGFHFIDFDDPRQGIAHVVAPSSASRSRAPRWSAATATRAPWAAWARSHGASALPRPSTRSPRRRSRSQAEAMRVTFDGRLAPGVYAKDMILALIGRIGAQGGIGYATEFAGRGRALPIEGRLTICNMSIEFPCKYGFVPPDDATIEFLAGREFSPKGEAWDAAVAYWRTLAPTRARRSTARWRSTATPRAAGDLGHQPAAGRVDRRLASPTPRPPTRGAQLAERALGYMRLEPARRCGACRSTWPTSARAPTRGCRTCARRPRC